MPCVCSCICAHSKTGAFLPALMTIKQQPPQNWQTGFQEATDKTQLMDYMFSARNFCLHLMIPEFTKRQKPPSAHSPADNISHNAPEPRISPETALKCVSTSEEARRAYFRTQIKRIYEQGCVWRVVRGMRKGERWKVSWSTSLMPVVNKTSRCRLEDVHAWQEWNTSLLQLELHFMKFSCPY